MQTVDMQQLKAGEVNLGVCSPSTRDLDRGA